MSLSGEALFEAVLKACGLHPAVAPFTVRRLLLRVGVVKLERLTPQHLERALPHFAQELPKFFDRPEGCGNALARLRALLSA